MKPVRRPQQGILRSEPPRVGPVAPNRDGYAAHIVPWERAAPAEPLDIRNGPRTEDVFEELAGITDPRVTAMDWLSAEYGSGRDWLLAGFSEASDEFDGDAVRWWGRSGICAAGAQPRDRVGLRHKQVSRHGNGESWNRFYRPPHRSLGPSGTTNESTSHRRHPLAPPKRHSMARDSTTLRSLAHLPCPLGETAG